MGINRTRPQEEINTCINFNYRCARRRTGQVVHGGTWWAGGERRRGDEWCAGWEKGSTRHAGGYEGVRGRPRTGQASVPVASRLSVALVAAYRLLTVRRGGRWTVTPGVDGGAQERVVGGGRRRAGAGGGWRHAGAGGRRRHRRARRGAVRLRRRRQQWRRRRTRSCGRTGWHNATVATVIGDGRIALLSGISAQDLFVWFPVYGIRVDVPCSSVIYFNVGVVFKHFPLAVCEAPPPSPDTGLGLGRQCRWGQRPHGRH
uniref:Uncharacterized protein n=1 Tax=Oryza sativa subsp. japonica TaxID=39947 RepID=Q6K2I8_ORYSJ|nr:hypothetical protein [Oryza sativa Japonica Group]